MDRPTKKQVL